MGHKDTRSGAELLGPVSVLLQVGKVCWVRFSAAQKGHSFAPFQKIQDDCKSWHT